MKFVLMPDSLSAAWFRSILAVQGIVGVKVGTFPALLDNLESLWLLPRLEDNFSARLKAEMVVSASSFWVDSIKVDEPAVLAEVEASLKHVLSVLSLNDRISPIATPKNRVEHYFNDIAALHEGMDHVLPHDQMIAKQWLASSQLTAVDYIQLIHLPELFCFEAWQVELIESLLALNTSNRSGDALTNLLKTSIYNSVGINDDIKHLSQNIFNIPHQGKQHKLSHIRWLACRDSLQEVEVLVGMVQKALASGVDIKDMAVVVPDHDDYLETLPKLLKASGILTSNHHAASIAFQWDIQLIKDLLVYYSKKTVDDSSVPPMCLAAIVTNPLMPWSLARGQKIAEDCFSDRLEEKVIDGSYEDLAILKTLLNPTPEKWQDWLVEVIDDCEYLSRGNIYSKTGLHDVISSLGESALLYKKDAQLTLSVLISQLNPKSMRIEPENSGLVSNGILLLTESEWLFHPLKHLFILGFNRGNYEVRDSSSGVFNLGQLVSLEETTGLLLNTSTDKISNYELRIKRLLSQSSESITFVLSQQDMEGEKLLASELLLDMAICFQEVSNVNSEELIQPIGSMTNPSPFFKTSDPESVIEAGEVEIRDLALDIDLIKLNAASDGTPRRESPSSLETLMISPLAWLLSRLRLESMSWDIQDLNVMLKGTVAHKVFELHFDSTSKFEHSNYDELFREALIQDAEFLLEPRWRLERTQLKHEIEHALIPFIQWCEEEGWEFHSTEERLEGSLWGLHLKGFADAVLIRGKNHLILDYKKSKSRDRITRLNNGYDLQTLIYRELYSQQNEIGSSAVHSGYYTLNDKTLVLDSDDQKTVDGIELARLDVSLIEQSAQAVALIKERIKQLKKGVVCLNTTADAKMWKDLGVSAEYTIDGNSLVSLHMKRSEDSANA